MFPLCISPICRMPRIIEGIQLMWILMDEVYISLSFVTSLDIFFSINMHVLQMYHYVSIFRVIYLALTCYLASPSCMS